MLKKIKKTLEFGPRLVLLQGSEFIIFSSYDDNKCFFINYKLSRDTHSLKMVLGIFICYLPSVFSVISLYGLRFISTTVDLSAAKKEYDTRPRSFLANVFIRSVFTQFTQSQHL